MDYAALPVRGAPRGLKPGGSCGARSCNLSARAEGEKRLRSTTKKPFAAAHRSKFARDYIAGWNGRILTERLPAYAPELNPVEYLWAHLKQHELPNVCGKDLWHLGHQARHTLKRMRRRPKLIAALWKQSSLLPSDPLSYARVNKISS